MDTERRKRKKNKKSGKKEGNPEVPMIGSGRNPEIQSQKGPQRPSQRSRDGSPELGSDPAVLQWMVFTSHHVTFIKCIKFIGWLLDILSSTSPNMSICPFYLFCSPKCTVKFQCRMLPCHKPDDTSQANVLDTINLTLKCNCQCLVL